MTNFLELVSSLVIAPSFSPLLNPTTTRRICRLYSSLNSNTHDHDHQQEETWLRMLLGDPANLFLLQKFGTNPVCLGDLKHCRCFPLADLLYQVGVGSFLGSHLLVVRVFDNKMQEGKHSYEFPLLTLGVKEGKMLNSHGEVIPSYTLLRKDTATIFTRCLETCSPKSTRVASVTSVTSDECERLWIAIMRWHRTIGVKAKRNSQARLQWTKSDLDASWLYFSKDHSNAWIAGLYSI